MEASEKVLEKIRKLLALASCGGASEAEAANAAAQAQRLILKHHVDAALLGKVSGGGKDEPIETFSVEEGRKPGPFPEWWGFLCGALEKSFMVKTYRIRGQALYVCGRRTDVEAFRYTWAFLRAEIARLADRAYGAAFPLGSVANHPTPWKRSFCVGAVDTVARRMKTETEKVLAEAQGAQNPAAVTTEQRTTALVLRDRYAEVSAALEEKVGPLKSSKSRSEYSFSGYRAGQTAGESIQLRASPAAGRLPAARK